MITATLGFGSGHGTYSSDVQYKGFELIYHLWPWAWNAPPENCVTSRVPLHASSLLRPPPMRSKDEISITLPVLSLIADTRLYCSTRNVPIWLTIKGDTISVSTPLSDHEQYIATLGEEKDYYSVSPLILYYPIFISNGTQLPESNFHAQMFPFFYIYPDLLEPATPESWRGAPLISLPQIMY